MDELVAAAQEERFSRKKHDDGFPTHAIEYCLSEAGLKPSQLDFVGFYDKPFLKFERLLETYLAYAPAGFDSFLKAMPLWLKQKLHLPREMRRGLKGEYQQADSSSPNITNRTRPARSFRRHLRRRRSSRSTASANGPPPASATAAATRSSCRTKCASRIRWACSIRRSPITAASRSTRGEYKLMGLAPYGEPKYVDLIFEKLIDLKEDGSFRMDMSYFNYCQGLTMTSREV